MTSLVFDTQVEAVARRPTNPYYRLYRVRNPAGEYKHVWSRGAIEAAGRALLSWGYSAHPFDLQPLSVDDLIVQVGLLSPGDRARFLQALKNPAGFPPIPPRPDLPDSHRYRVYRITPGAGYEWARMPVEALGRASQSLGYITVANSIASRTEGG